VPVAGNAADQVLSINSLADFSRFHARLGHLQNTQSRPQHIMIMGGGLIGCEFANDLAGAGYHVSVADPASGPIAALLPAQASHALRDALAGLGVQWHLGTSVKSVNLQVPGGAGDASPALQVEMANGHLAQVDVVLSAIGLRADTTLAQAAGLVCDRGVVVDASLQTSALHIYALGDSAQYASGRWMDAVNGELPGGRTMPFVMPIMGAARALVATLAGTHTPVVFPLMPVAIKTPALPIVVAAPAPGTPGAWSEVEPGLWHFRDESRQPHGFVLAGPQTARRAEQVRLLAAA
jgi:rubredoxin-NAD+ reductase